MILKIIWSIFKIFFQRMRKRFSSSPKKSTELEEDYGQFVEFD